MFCFFVFFIYVCDVHEDLDDNQIDRGTFGVIGKPSMKVCAQSKYCSVLTNRANDIEFCNFITLEIRKLVVESHWAINQ